MGASCGDVGKGTLEYPLLLRELYVGLRVTKKKRPPGGVLPGRRGVHKNMINHVAVLFTLEPFLRGLSLGGWLVAVISTVKHDAG